MKPLLPYTFTAFGISLKKLVSDDLPLLCKWHNDDDILPFMADLRKVSVPILDFWLKKMDASGKSFPFFAYFQEKPIGYVDVRNCDYERSCCEDGVIIFDSNRYGIGLGSRIWLCRELVLRALNIRDVFSCIRPKNQRSISFFEKMGGTFVENKNGFMLYKQECSARMAALHRVAAQLGLLEEYEKYFGDLH